MNISDSGQVCVDLLKHNWSPALSLFKVLLSISSLLTDPNPSECSQSKSKSGRSNIRLSEDPLGMEPINCSFPRLIILLVPAIATEYSRKRKQHDATARNWTELYARPKRAALPQASGSSKTTLRPPQAHNIDNPPEVIVIDDTPPRTTRQPRPRAVARPSSSLQVVTIDDEMPVLPRSKKRKPASSSESQGRTRRRVGEGSNTGNHDVIVIDE
jgi:hypothetical protein